MTLDEFLFIRVDEAGSARDAENTVKDGSGRRGGGTSKKRDENRRGRETGFKGKRGTMGWLPCRTNSFANSFNDVTTR